MAPPRTPLVRIDAAAALAARAASAQRGSAVPPPSGERPRRITLQRASGGPLIFHGLDLWTADTRDGTALVWHVLRLFDLPDGRYALAIQRFSDPGGTLEASYAEILPSAEAVLAAAESFDPATGVPPDGTGRGAYSHAARRFRHLLYRQFGVELPAELGLPAEMGPPTEMGPTGDALSASHCHGGC